MNLVGMLANARPEERRIVNSASFRIRHFFWNLFLKKFSIFRVGELRECHLGEGLPEQSWGWERVVSADTGESIIRINIEKKLEVDEAERYIQETYSSWQEPQCQYSPIPSWVTCVKTQWDWFSSDHSLQLFFLISCPPSDFSTAILVIFGLFV